MSFLNKLFGKKTYNIKNSKMAKVEEGTIYVWQKSERIGQIKIADKIDGQWLFFKDGSRINKDLINEYLSVSTSMEEAEQVSKLLSNVSTDNIAPIGQNIQNVNGATEKPTVTIKSKETLSNTPTFDEDDLMVGILEKLSKKNKTNLDVSVGIRLPSKTIFKALQQDVEDDELRRGLEKLVKKQINNIEEQLNNQVEQFIQNYYYEQTRKKKSL